MPAKIRIPLSAEKGRPMKRYSCGGFDQFGRPPCPPPCPPCPPPCPPEPCPPPCPPEPCPPPRPEPGPGPCPRPEIGPWLIGPVGPMGPQGPAGEPGPMGPQGPVGPTGATEAGREEQRPRKKVAGSGKKRGFSRTFDALLVQKMTYNKLPAQRAVFEREKTTMRRIFLEGDDG